ncbi:MAG: alpha/beta hydrolase fold domain-containing protein, partial [Desulfobacterales bacterium]|nr:alpha/beta hydrolase fold domain-containing protein [Desulfobacterales bacterium]
MPLSPRLVDFLEGVNKLTARLKARGAAPTPGDSRMRMDALARYMSARPEIAHVEDGVIHHDGIETPVRIYSPEPEEALPVLVYYHGGGCMCGSVELYDPIVRKIARAARVIVASVEYRLAPENPYPAGLNDARAAAGNIWR